jgi:hypothetical protein
VCHGLLWLAWIDHARSWLRSALSVLALALAVYAIALFGHQVELRQAEVLAGYEAAGASSFVIELANTRDRDLDGLADALRSVGGVASIAAPYNGADLGIGVDVSFEVFRNETQQEYLGARTSALGIDQSLIWYVTTTSTFTTSTLTRQRVAWVYRSSSWKAKHDLLTRMRCSFQRGYPTTWACERTPRRQSNSYMPA